LLDQSLAAGALAAEIVDLLNSAEQTAALTALLVDDDTDFVGGATSVLRRHGVDVVVRPDSAGFLRVLDPIEPDIVIASADLPRGARFSLASALRGSTRWRHIPLILVTQDVRGATRTRCFDAGANDDVNTPLLPAELWGRVHAWIAVARLRTSERRRDSLTGLRARQGCLTELSRRVELGQPQVAFVIRLSPGLREVNLKHGFEVGDEVVRQLATDVLNLVPTLAVVGRWSGGSLLVGVPQSDAAEVRIALDSGCDQVRVGEGLSEVLVGTSVRFVKPTEEQVLTDALRIMEWPR
jgi:PleD family two-component response regulator